MYIPCLLGITVGLCWLYILASAFEYIDGDKLVDSLHTLEEFRGISKRDIQPAERRKLERKKRRLCPVGRVRKEFRQLTDREWREFVSALNAIKQTGEYDKLARIHRGKRRIAKAHGGANFLGWHRIYLLCLEELLRRVEPCVTIPYWDSTLDYVLKNASWTIMFTEHFIGNGNGYVRTGPFNNWITGEGDRLTRQTAASGSLFFDDAINDMLNRKTHFEVTSGRIQKYRNYSIENMHGAVHSWVNGQMSVLPSATEDPVFFMLHSFVDCLWLWFTEVNNITNPYFDYPDVGGDDAPDNLMDPWALLEPLYNITNREGYLPSLLLNTCHPRPTCSKQRPTCYSKYLRCSVTTEKCESLVGDWSKTGPPDFSERPPIRKGQKFNTTFFDPRTRNDSLPQLIGTDENDPTVSAWAKNSKDVEKKKPIPKQMLLP